MTTCSATSRALAEPLAGTAAIARTWLLIEQPGPWGAKALAQSHFPPELGDQLEANTEATGVRVALIRRPGRHPDQHGPLTRRMIIAHTEPGRSWVRTTLLERPEELHNLPFDRLGAGDHGDLGEPHIGDPLTLVCTNGKRDRCCAVLGRPLAAELAMSGDSGVWETTHLGGHRFAPTLLMLPYGYAYGRTSTPEAKQLLEELRQGRMVMRGCRGRSTWGRPGQTADLAVRERIGDRDGDAVTVSRIEDRKLGGWMVTVEHRDGRRWGVAVQEDTTAPPTPASCGAADRVQSRMNVADVTELPPG